jgi:hypothetical protein
MIIDDKKYDPHIVLQTALAICGEELISSSGFIAGLALHSDELDRDIRRHVLANLKEKLAKVHQRIAQYEAATFAAPRVSPTEYEALIARECEARS